MTVQGDLLGMLKLNAVVGRSAVNQPFAHIIARERAVPRIAGQIHDDEGGVASR